MKIAALVIVVLLGLVGVVAALSTHGEARVADEFIACSQKWEALRAKQCTEAICQVVHDPGCINCNRDISDLRRLNCDPGPATRGIGTPPTFRTPRSP